MNLTDHQKVLLQDVLTRLNARRQLRGRRPIGETLLPPLRGSVERYYLVDTYSVRRHWRRRPCA